MAKGSVGRQVARAAATGGGRTSRGEIPLGWYGSLALISVVGIFVVGFSRYEAQHPTAKPVVHPIIGDNWNVALGIYDCNRFLPNLSASSSSANVSFLSLGNGLIHVSPKVAADEGTGATLGKFASGYKGLKFSKSSVTIPGKGTISAGASCNGKPTQLETSVWSSLLDTHPKIYQGDPSKVVFSANGELITVGFVPKGVALPKPPSSGQLANVGAASTTTTQAKSVTTTTAAAGSNKTSSTSTTKVSSKTTSAPG